MKIGDLIRDHLIPFTKVSPYLALIATLPLIAGLQSIFLVLLSSTLSALFFILLFNKNEIVSRPKMGEIQQAEDNILEANNKKPKTAYYFAKFGTVISSFKGDTTEQARKQNLQGNNIIYDYLVGKSLYTMGILLAGATGAGKTVSLTSTVVHPLIKTGGGFAMLEGKGDRTISEGIYAMAAEHGREEDIFFLDFGSASAGGFTHSVAPLANGSALVLNETLTNIITIMEGDNSWVSDLATELMQAILFPLVCFRDLNIFIEPKNFKHIQKLEDFDKFKKVDFNLTHLGAVLNYQTLIELTYAYRSLVRDKNFTMALRNHPKHKSVTDYETTYLFPLTNFMTNQSLDITNEMAIPIYNDIAPAETKKQNNYAISPWTKALLNFGNESIYGAIFNKEYADINFLDAFKSGKIIIASLPSLQNSREKNLAIGKMLTALIKNALGEMLAEGEIEGSVAQKEAQKRYRPYKLPYMIIFDEVSNYGNEMFGQMASMVRSIGVEGGGMGILVSGQSKTDLDRMGDNGIDGKQLVANLGISYFLNLSDPGQEGYAQLASDYCGKHYRFELKEDLLLNKTDNKTSDLTRSLDRKEEDWYPRDFFQKKLKKMTGEGIIVQNGFPFPEKIIANYIESKPFYKDVANKNCIVLAKNISHKKLMSYFELDNEQATAA